MIGNLERAAMKGWNLGKVLVSLVLTEGDKVIVERKMYGIDGKKVQFCSAI